MKAEEKQLLNEKIDEEMVRLNHEIELLVEQTKPVAPDRAIGRLTRMEAINAKSIAEANLRNARSRVTKLEQALTRVDDEDFGICTRCERPIPYKRILLVPESTRCVRCAG